MCTSTTHEARRRMLRSVASDDEEKDTVSALPLNDNVFVDQKSNASDDEVDGCGNEVGLEKEEKEDIDTREPIITRIDSYREINIKVNKRKMGSVRRHMVGQHSLQPCNPSFSLRIPDTGVDDLVVAKRGSSLKNTLLQYFGGNVAVFLSYDFFIEGSNSALPLDAQSDLLAGHIIHAIKRDPAIGRIVKERKKRSSTGSSFTTTKKPATKLSHASSLQHLSFKDSDYIEMPIGTLPRMRPPSNPMQRLTRMLSPSKERLDRLEETLQAFETTGIPFRHCPTANNSTFHVKLKWLEMENSWEEIVDKPETLSLQDKLQQSVIWELLLTEANYIRNLKAVVDVHLATLSHLQNSDEHILCDIDIKKMFSNFEEIYVANGLFWKNYLYKLLKATRRSRRPLHVRYLYEGFINIAKSFQPYSSFCIHTNASRQYVQEKKESDSLFAKFIRWADSRIASDCNKEGIKDQLSKPFQRLMRYKLLLDRIKDETGDSAQRRMVKVMVRRVAEFVQDVDDRVAASQKYATLVELSKRVDYNIPIDSPGDEYSRLVDKFPSFDLLLPMPHNKNYRELLFECSLKYRDHLTKWTDVTALLFTDMFLVAKLTKKGTCDKYKIFRPPVKLEKIFIEQFSDNPLQYLLYILDDFGYLRMTQAVSGNANKLKEWVQKVNSTKEALAKGAPGIDRSQLSDEAAAERRPSSVALIVTPSSPIAIAPRSIKVCSTQTLAITDMRRRFKTSNSSDEATRPDELSRPSSAADSHSSIDLKEREEELEGLQDVDGDADGEDDEVMIPDHPGVAASRQMTRFLRTASPVQRRHQNQQRQLGISPPSEPPDQPALDDNPCDMTATAFRNRRGSRGDRRYRTADSVMPAHSLEGRSSSIYKRFSLNYGGTVTQMAQEACTSSSLPPTSPTGVPGLPATSVESFQSSSGFSSSGSAQHLHSGSDFSEPGGVQDMLHLGAEVEGMGVNRALEIVGPHRERVPLASSSKRMSAPRHCMSLNDLSRLQLDTISDTNDNEDDSPEGNSSSTSVRSVRKPYVVIQSSDGEGTDV